uniref:Uncharacterized protein n=1 Tax=Candidatus Kentrum sp. LFY TaxID=2126342 RepID=A0A450V0Z4_9GAMM|nr:MAG: hypothetical protein BECKLFY1418A_GA0070994_10846 [Candidatus Kentron sp. LFY]
MLPAGAVIL